MRPIGKLLSVKSVVFFTYSQSCAISALVWFNLLPQAIEEGGEHWSTEDVGRGLQDYLICIEMLVAAIVFSHVFSHHDYRDGAFEEGLLAKDGDGELLGGGGHHGSHGRGHGHHHHHRTPVKGFGSPKAKARAAAAAATTTTMASLSLPLPLPLPAPPAAAARLKAARDLSPERTSLHLPLLHATSVGSSSSSSSSISSGGGGGSNGNALSMSGFSSSPVRGNRGRFMTTGSATIDV